MFCPRRALSRRTRLLLPIRQQQALTGGDTLDCRSDEQLEDEMERDKLEVTAVKIGRALAKTHRTARWIAEAVQVTTEQLHQLSKQIETMADQLKKSEERLKRTLR
jgi:hypothetical protein